MSCKQSINNEIYTVYCGIQPFVYFMEKIFVQNRYRLFNDVFGIINYN